MYNFLQPRTGAGGFLKLMLAGLVLQVPLAAAQFTQVQGTVVDPQGLPYSNGTIFPNLIISGSPRFTASGFPYVPPGQPTALDSHGSFVMSIADVTQLTPSGGVWSFTVNCGAGCIPPAAGAGPITFTTTGLIISGTVQDISSVLDLAAPPLTGGPGGGVGLTPGTTGQFLFFTSPNTAAGTPLLTTDGTTLTTTTFLNCPLNAKCLSTSNGGIGFNTNGAAAVFNSAGANVGQLLGIRTNNTQVASLTAAPYANFNNTTPAAPINGINLQWQSAQSGGVGVISAAIVGDGVSTNCFIGTGIFAPCNTGTVTGFAGAATTNPTPCKALGGQNTLQATTTSDTGPGIAIGICDPSSGTTTILRTTGLLSGSSSPILGSGTCSIGQFVVVDPTTNGAITCTSTFTAGTVIGKAASNQTTIGFNVNIYLGLR